MSGTVPNLSPPIEAPIAKDAFLDGAWSDFFTDLADRLNKAAPLDAPPFSGLVTMDKLSVTGTMSVGGAATFNGALVATSTAQFNGGIGFFGATPIGRAVIVGGRGGNVALLNLMAALNALGIVTDSTTT